MSPVSTISAIATPPGQGAVSLIRMSGPDSLEIAQQLFVPFPSTIEPRKQHFGRCLDKDGSIIDECLFTWFRAPSSFTGEEVVEIGCHGGPVVTNCVLQRTLELGASPAEPGEFSQRAFLNGKIDLTQAEAIMDLISAKTDLAARAASQQLTGNLGGEVEGLRQKIIGVLAHVEAYIDFPDEDIDPESHEAILARIGQANQRIDLLLATAERGRILREGIRTTICGAPNAGKSSLLNRLVGFDRAIVSDRPGTTRDTIEETINLGGIPIRIIDTAGIRHGGDDLEQEGMKRSREAMEQAELVLLVVDSTRPKSQLETLAIPGGKRVVTILNKADLTGHPDWLETTEEGDIRFSCLENQDLTPIESKVLDQITGKGAGSDASDLIAINARHQHYLTLARSALEASIERLGERASPDLVAFEIREALQAIGDIVGQTDAEEILGSIFSTFCIGK